MTNPARSSVAICTSVSSYKEAIDLSRQVEKLGITARLPGTAEAMKNGSGHNDESAIDWSSDAGQPIKAGFIRAHFEVIAACDAILVANYTKHDKPNYIGPNVLMEMAVAFFLHKPIYLLHDIPKDSALLDEIRGLCPITLKGDLDGLAALQQAQVVES